MKKSLIALIISIIFLGTCLVLVLFSNKKVNSIPMDVTYVKDNFVINLSDNIETDSITLTGQADYVGEDEILENPEIKLGVSCFYTYEDNNEEFTNLLDEDIVKAHEDGILHFHDADYFAQHMHNCDLVNLEDMLQNGTVISGTMIEKPHSFSTACNIATQIIAQVASSQYGGQSISLTHLAPFVDVSRQKIRQNTIDELKMVGIEPTEENIAPIVGKEIL